MAVNANIRTAKRDFDAFLTWIHETLASMTPAQQVLAICICFLILIWLAFLRPSEYDDDERAMGRQFNMALGIVLIFGLGAGFFLTPNIASLGNLLG
ncbi:MAG: hypothetical protein AAF829_00060 [Pseudomonadota bacterium]